MKSLLIISNYWNESGNLTELPTFIEQLKNAYKLYFIGNYNTNNITIPLINQYINLIKTVDIILFVPEYTAPSDMDKLCARNNYGRKPFLWWANQLNTLRPKDFFVYNAHDNFDKTEFDIIFYLNYKKYIKREHFNIQLKPRLDINKYYPELIKKEIIDNIIPFVPFHMNRNAYMEINKDIEISYLIPKHTIKRGIREYFKSNLINIDNIYVLEDGVSKNEYVKLMNRSKISISAWGGGYSCWRDFEILESSALLALQKTPIMYAYDMFIDMENIILFDTVEELITKSNIILNNPDLYNTMVTKQKEIAKKYHSKEARYLQLKYILEDKIINDNCYISIVND